MLESFLQDAGTSLLHFRYFDKRPLECIKNHLCTFLISESGIPIAYGHLDKEPGSDTRKSTIWLGIAVSENQKGRGWGMKMMEALLSFAAKNKLDVIRLSVDKDNYNAISLYKKHGFIPDGEGEHIQFFKLILNS